MGTASASEPAEPAAWIGTWTSPACGERAWERTIVLEDGGAYHGRDPISPCPPGASCIWSGVIEFRGSWRVVGAQIELAESPDRRPPMAQAYQRPAILAITGESLVDPQGCRYDRKPAEK